MSYLCFLQPDTVPQARLDMFTAIAVEEADEATGNPHSLAVTSSDRSIHFVRGACREEAKGWKDVLTSYMRHTTQVSFFVFTKTLFFSLYNNIYLLKLIIFIMSCFNNLKVSNFVYFCPVLCNQCYK